MRFVFYGIVANVAAFAALVYPAYSWRGETGVWELASATIGVMVIFCGSLVLLHRSIAKPGPHTGTMMLGKMGLHMVGMLLLFLVLPKLTGLELKGIIVWLIGLFFLNLAVEVFYLIRISKMLERGAEKA